MKQHCAYLTALSVPHSTVGDFNSEFHVSHSYPAPLRPPLTKHTALKHTYTLPGQQVVSDRADCQWKRRKGCHSTVVVLFSSVNSNQFPIEPATGLNPFTQHVSAFSHMAAKHITEMHNYGTRISFHLSSILPLFRSLCRVCLSVCLPSTQSVCAESCVFHDRSGMTLSDLSVDTTLHLWLVSTEHEH